MILSFAEITPQDLGRVGGKGLNLGALARAGFPVPPGFCVTTEAFAALRARVGAMPALYAELDAVGGDVEATRAIGERVRAALLSVPMPEEAEAAITAAWQRLGPAHAYAVRSSATAEDLPGASFAGQQDTYLNIIGRDGLLDAVRRCWASLFTDRAILYRARGGFGHRAVSLCVVVQRMVLPEAAGILFTADPVSGHRGTISIDAGFGLGEALVSGLVNADLYRVDKGTLAEREARIGDKALAIMPLPGGGTEQVALPEARRGARVLSAAQVQELARLGLAVEAHYQGAPQDLEWCIEQGRIYLVQARPITSLYPLVQPRPDDGAVHVYFSFSHGQNMTDPITPLGRDILRAILPFGRQRLGEGRLEDSALADAGGRLYVDVTRPLRVRLFRRLILGALSGVYPALAQGIAQLADRPEVARSPRPSRASVRMVLRLMWRVPPRLLYRLLWAPPEATPAVAEELVTRTVAAFHRRIEAAPAGAPRLREACRALGEIFLILPRLPPLLGSGLIALRLLRRRFAGTPQAPDVEALQRGLIGNITTEMDLLVADLADTARSHEALIAALQGGVDGKAGLAALRELAGGPAFLATLEAFLDRFGMRCQGEIDIGRTRWAEEPSLLLASVAGNLSGKDGGGGSHRAHFAKLQQEAEGAGKRLEAAAGNPLGRRWVRRLVSVVRYGLGVREHPKYMMIQCLGMAREAIVREAEGLAARGRIDAVGDVWFLGLAELLALLEDPAAKDPRPEMAARKQEHARFAHLTPPLVLTSEGETPIPERPKDLPPGALAGLGASSGVIEGVARVVLDPTKQVLNAGEILVAPYTDPGWTPLFIHAAGLVCDVGGMMTHGSVVAREYGIPAVVGVGDGTKRIKSGDRLRLDGSRGIVEILPADDGAAAGATVALGVGPMDRGADLGRERERPRHRRRAPGGR